MRVSSQDKIFNDFPQLYRDRHLPDTVTRIGDGLCCGEGWFEILYNLSKEIDDFCKKHNLTGNNYVCAWQVKSKLGGLRFYTGLAWGHKYTDIVPLTKEQNEELRAIICNAEELSFKTCETCGKPGKLYEERNWLYIACDEHKGNGVEYKYAD
jgi:hypothetical protein